MDMGHVVYRPNDNLAVASLGHGSNVLLGNFKKLVGDLPYLRAFRF
ncbi:MAG: hypothetical protein WCB11_30000 [Terriglobales bacterium]